MIALSVLLTTTAARAEDGATDEPAASAAEITLSDGQVITGEVVEGAGGDYVITLSDGVSFILPAEAVDKLSPVESIPGAEASAWSLDPNRSRYLYSPTAFPLGQGNGYVAQRALVLTSAAMGVTDFMDIEVGTVIPTLFIPDGIIVVGGAKLAGRVSDKLRIGAGAQLGVLPESTTGGLVFANATYGTADSHVTVAGGAALGFDADKQLFAWMGTVGANHRLGPKAALITENWFMWFVDMDGPWGGPFFVVPSGGVRLFGPSFAVDLALVPLIIAEAEVPVIPVPWISFAWNWSLKRTR